MLPSNRIQELHDLIRKREKATRIWKRLELDIRKKKTEYEQVLYSLRVKLQQLNHAKLILTNQVQTPDGLDFHSPKRGVLSYDHLSFYRGLAKIRFEPEVLAQILSNLPTRISEDPLAQLVQGKEHQLATFLVQGIYASPSTHDDLARLLRFMLRFQLQSSSTNSLTTIPHILTELLRCVTIQAGKTFVSIALLDPLVHVTSATDLKLTFQNFEEAEPWCMEILESCISSLLDLPQVVVSIVQELILCGSSMSSTPNQLLTPTHSLLVEFIFLHWLVQALVTPEGVGIFLTYPITSTARFNLQVLGTILLKVCCILTGVQQSCDPVLDRITKNILPKLTQKLNQVEQWFAPTDDEDGPVTERDNFYGMMVVDNNSLRMFHQLLKLNPATPANWKEFADSLTPCDHQAKNQVFVCLDCSPVMNEHMTGPKFEDMRATLSKEEDEFRHMLRSALMTMDRVPNIGIGSLQDMLRNLTERKSLQWREIMVMRETLERVSEYQENNLEEMLDSMLHDERAICTTLVQTSLNLPHQVLDMLCVDIRSLHALTQETQRNIFNILIQEVLTFVTGEIPKFATKMKKLVNIMHKLEQEHLDPEEEQNIVEDRFISRRTAKSMSKLRNELIRFLNATGISPCTESTIFTSLPALNFGDEYVALSLQDYVLKNLGESFWISGTDDEDFYRYLIQLNETFRDFNHFFEFVDHRSPPRITEGIITQLVEELQTLSDKWEVGYKISVLRKCRDALSSVLALCPYSSSDDYLPFFCYIVMRANVPKFLSQLHFVKIISQRKAQEKVFVDCVVTIKYLLSFPTDKLRQHQINTGVAAAAPKKEEANQTTIITNPSETTIATTTESLPTSTESQI